MKGERNGEGGKEGRKRVRNGLEKNGREGRSFSQAQNIVGRRGCTLDFEEIEKSHFIFRIALPAGFILKYILPENRNTLEHFLVLRNFVESVLVLTCTTRIHKFLQSSLPQEQNWLMHLADCS